jgi:hypothetical protein
MNFSFSSDISSFYMLYVSNNYLLKYVLINHLYNLSMLSYIVTKFPCFEIYCSHQYCHMYQLL